VISSPEGTCTSLSFSSTIKVSPALTVILMLSAVIFAGRSKDCYAVTL
jgi:hypothetical protein